MDDIKLFTKMKKKKRIRNLDRKNTLYSLDRGFKLGIDKSAIGII